MRTAAKAILAYVAIVAIAVLGINVSANAAPKAPAQSTVANLATPAVTAPATATVAPTDKPTVTVTHAPTAPVHPATTVPVKTAPAYVAPTPKPVAPKPVAKPTPKPTTNLQCGFYSADHTKLWNDPSMKYTRDVLTSEHTKATYLGSKVSRDDAPTCAGTNPDSLLTIQGDNDRWDYYLLTK